MARTFFSGPVVTKPTSGQVVDAAYYGIVPSTTKDQTTNFQTMVDDITAGRGGARTLVLPAGEIHITDTINITQGTDIAFWPRVGTDTLDAVSGIHLIGQGNYATSIHMDTDGKAAFRIYNSASSTTKVEGVLLEKFGLYGQGVTDTGSCAIQLGGVSASQTDVIVRSFLRDLYIEDFYSGIRVDDCTNLHLEGLWLTGVRYGVEMGFNIDICTALQCMFGSRILHTSLAGTGSSGTAVVTGISDTSLLRVGMRVISTAFPQGTEILSIDSGTQVTMDTNGTVTGAITMAFVFQTAISYGGGPWTPAFNTPGGSNAHKFLGCWFMRNADAFDVVHTSAANISVDTCYFERCNRTAKLGSSASPTSTKVFTLTNCHFSQTNSSVQDAVVWDDSGAAGDSHIAIRDCRSDVMLSNVPWLRMRSANGSLIWENNELGMSSGDSIHIFDSTTGYTPSNYTRFDLRTGNAISFVEEVGVTGTLTPRFLPGVSHQLSVGPITGAITMNGPSAGTENGMFAGCVYTFILQEDGTAGHAITWNSTYKFHTAWTDSTVTTDADKYSFVTFYYDGADFRQISPANSWVA